MKKILSLAIMSVFLLSVLSLTAFADLSADTSLSLGSKKQRASNPLADRVTDRDEFITNVQITLQNTDTVNTLTGVKLASVTLPISKITAALLDITVTFDPNDIPTGATEPEIAAGSSIFATLSIRVPENLDAVDANTLKERSFHVATLNWEALNGTTILTDSTVVNMQRENQLEIDDVEICINGNQRCVSPDDGDDVEHLRPGDDIDMTITVENKYSDSSKEDVDIEDVELSFEIDEDDFNEDDDESLGDLDADDKDSESFAFTIDTDVDDGKQKMTIRVFGDDENGAFHGEEIDIDLEVDKKTHDVEIRSARVSPSLISCENTRTTATITFTNLGKRDEDEVAVEITSDVLGISQRKGLFSLDEGDSRTESISLTLPENLDAGIYDLTIRSFFDESSLSDEETIQVTVPDCEANADDETNDDVTVQVTDDSTSVNVGTPITAQPVARPVNTGGDSSSFTDSPAYTVLLALGVLALLAVLVVVVVKFVKPQE